jgi:hypothetical protein
MTLVSVHHTLFNFHLFRLHCRPFICHPLSSLAIVVRPPRVVASSADCSPHVLSYRPLAQQHCCGHRHCVFLPPPPSLVARHAVHSPLLPQPTTAVDQLLRSSSFFVRRLLSFTSSPVYCLLRSSSLGPAKGGGGDAAGVLQVPKIRSTKASMPFDNNTTIACRLLHLRREGAALAVVLAPCPDVVFVVVDAAMIVIIPPHHPQRGGSNDRCVGSCCWRRTIYPPPCPRRRSSGRTGSIRCHRARSHRHQC